MHIFKKILLIMAVFASGLLIGCETENVTASDLFNHTFEMECLEYDLVNFVGDFYLYVDKETNIEYIVVTTSDGVSICPRYYADTSLYRR